MTTTPTPCPNGSGTTATPMTGMRSRTCVNCGEPIAEHDGRAVCYHVAHCGATVATPCTATPRRRRSVTR